MSWHGQFPLRDGELRRVGRVLDEPQELRARVLAEPRLHEGETCGEVVYTLRIRGRSYSPKVFRAGPYTLKVGTGDGKWKVFKGLTASAEKDAKTLDVSF